MRAFDTYLSRPSTRAAQQGTFKLCAAVDVSLQAARSACRSDAESDCK